jgi:iron complex outermembrane receptor protein
LKKSILFSSAMASLPLLLGAAAPAFAQDDGWALEEVVVTAQKREQRLQDVPASVTALTTESLAINRIQDIIDLDSVTPNLTITNVPAGNTSPVFSMRGVVGSGTAPGADKGIAYYIDGVFVGSASGSSFDLAEIERVEVLKGPQGTLFGRNSTGGAISITTRGPRGDFHFKQQVTVGNYDQIQSRTRIDTPQFGPFSAAFSYAHSERRGDIRNTGYGTVWNATRFGGPLNLRSPKWLGSDDTDSWAAAVKWDVSDNIELNYKFDKTDGTFSEIGVGTLGIFLPTLVNFNASSGFPNVVNRKRPKALNNWATSFSEVKASGHVLQADWRINDSLTVKNIIAYRKSEYSGPLAQLDGLGGLFAAPGVPFLGIVTLSAGTDKQWSEELQIDYDSDFVHLTTGGLYYDQKNQKGAYGSGFNQITFSAVPGFVLPTTPVPSRQSDVTVRSWALYAQGEFHVMDQLDVVLGARYTDDKKRGVDRTIPVIGTLDYDDSRWTYNVGLNYKPNNDMLFYGKYSTGYISGGRLATLDYAPETAKSWEAGVKADWLGRRLRTNLALFSAKYGNLQVAGSGLTFGVPAAAQVLVNAGNAKAKGLELEMTAVPIESVTLSANLGYLDFKFTELDPRYVAAGNTLPSQRPKWTLNLSGQYETPPVLGDSRITFRADANFRSEHDGSGMMATRAITRLPEVWMVNGRISLDEIALGQATGTLALWGRNLLDDKSPRYIINLGVATSVAYERARTFGMDFTVEF